MWGILVACIARHAALAYAKHGQDPKEAMRRIGSVFEVEWKKKLGES